MIRNWAAGKHTPLEVMAERESIYQLLSQTTPENLNKNFSHYTIDPYTRFVAMYNMSLLYRKLHCFHQYDFQTFHKFMFQISKCELSPFHT